MVWSVRTLNDIIINGGSYSAPKGIFFLSSQRVLSSVIVFKTVYY